MTAVWRSDPRPRDYEVADRVEDGEYVEPRMREEWYERLLKGSEAREKLIIFYTDEEDDSDMVVQFAVRFSERNREIALANMTSRERAGWIQTPVARSLSYSSPSPASPCSSSRWSAPYRERCNVVLAFYPSAPARRVRAAVYLLRVGHLGLHEHPGSPAPDLPGPLPSSSDSYCSSASPSHAGKRRSRKRRQGRVLLT